MSIQEICDKYSIINYTINQDGTIDVDGNINLSEMELTKLPLKFNRVNGYFYCSSNNLTDLKGSPKSVGGSFYCSNNNLTTLEGCSESVARDFYCDHNNLTTLIGGPKSVGGHFYCYHNPIGSILEEMSIDFIRAFNTFKVLKDNTINLKRLKYVMEMFNKRVDLKKIKKYYKLS